MKPFRVLLVDDEAPARRRMRRLLRNHLEVKVIAEASSCHQAKELIRSLRPELIFLDVEMGAATGFDLFENNKTITAAVIFVTAYENYARQAFDVRAIDYLLKPVRPERLAIAISRALEVLKSLEKHDEQTLKLKVGYGYQRVKLDDILCITAQDDYTEVFLKESQSILTKETMNSWENRLPSVQFVRIHRSTIVRLDQIAELLRIEGSWKVRLEQVSSLFRVSRLRLAGLKEILRLR